tara:strand:- start:1884 stop:2747 length:864 start_codon:yes stop_codon:yes gene_type:complete
MKKINTVVVHDKHSAFLETSLRITSKNNLVYLIGGESVRHLDKYENIIYVDINKYFHKDKFKRYKDKFEHFGDKDEWSYYFWFMRLFIIHEFMKDYNFTRIFSCDSDNILLDDVNKYPFKAKNAIVIPQVWEDHWFTSSVHAGLITEEFCENYEMLYEDIFINKSKFNLIEDKINHHKSNPGGVCDMTLYHYIVKFGLVDMQNLMDPVEIDGKKFVFINNFADGEGAKSREQYKTGRNKLKIYTSKKDKSNKIYDKISKEYLNLFNLHFQGKSKRLINTKLEKRLIF